MSHLIDKRPELLYIFWSFELAKRFGIHNADRDRSPYRVPRPAPVCTSTPISHSAVSSR